MKFGDAFIHFVQFHNASVVHSLPHDVYLDQNFLAARLAPTTFLEHFRGKLLTRLLTSAALHNRILAPAKSKPTQRKVSPFSCKLAILALTVRAPIPLHSNLPEVPFELFSPRPR